MQIKPILFYSIIDFSQFLYKIPISTSLSSIDLLVLEIVFPVSQTLPLSEDTFVLFE